MLPKVPAVSLSPVSLNPQPVIGVDLHSGAQHHGLGAQVVAQLQVPIHDGQSHIVCTLCGLAAPQHQPLSGLGAQAQLEVVALQRLLAVGKKGGSGPQEGSRGQGGEVGGLKLPMGSRVAAWARAAVVGQGRGRWMKGQNGREMEKEMKTRHRHTAG